MCGVFVTGTDTGVGKTVASAALMHRYRSPRLRYWKPIQTGIELDDDTAECRRLAGGNGVAVLDRGVRLPRPLSPHLSAELAGQTLELSAILAEAAGEAGSWRWVVEGAGGVLVPINSSETMADLMVRLAIPVVIVARTTLGTINHTLLTIEALRSRSLTVAGVILDGEGNAENRKAIERYGRVDILGELPRIDPLTSHDLGAWATTNLDTEGRLARWLQ
jgi:dethiobiotin synthase